MQAELSGCNFLPLKFWFPFLRLTSPPSGKGWILWLKANGSPTGGGLLQVLFLLYYRKFGFKNKVSQCGEIDSQFCCWVLFTG